MKCQKCTQPAVVHLTELFTDCNSKKAVELHLCYEHALESGLLAPPTQPTPTLPMHSHSKKKSEAGSEAGGSLTIIPKQPPAGLALGRKESAEGPSVCPICGATWASFKSSGTMGCPHDYVHFETKMVALVKRAHEGASQHAGKVPAKMRHTEVTRDVTASRLRRELQHAIDAERYEEAAKLRDALKGVGG